ncbi:MAG: hypothetical protein V7631_2295 [Massilia sp.]|jgi:pimeloyl-ACP methyl ester carboxylesterase
MKIDVSGETVEYVMAGEGGPGVVLVNGSGGPVDAWFKVFAALASERCTFAHNRPGIGASSKPVRAQTADEMVEALRDVLETVGVPRPYVLVGHSLGGLVVNLFARLYPEEVAAVVLLEATSPDDVRVLPQHENALQRGLKALGERLMPAHPLAETRHLDQTLAELEAAPPFPPIPLYVVTGEQHPLRWATPVAQREARARHQRALVTLSPLGKQVMAKGSGHFPQFSEPELVRATISAAAREAVAQGRHV